MEINLKEFDSTLSKGETIEWVGQSEPFPLKDSSNSGRLIMRWCLTAVVTVVLIIMYCVWAFKPEHNFSLPLVVIIAAVGLFIMLVPITDRRMILKKKYLVTNMNVITFTKESEKSIMSLENVDKADVYYTGKDTAHVVFSKNGAKETRVSGLRKLALIPRQADGEGDTPIVSMVFYNVKGVDLLKGSLPSRVKITEKK